MNTTPEGFRTAAYLEAKARFDARKTTRNIQCNPPNVRCGNRCIPPNWDCRLKGQGTDPHLRAVKTDPLGGLANIQRGFGRISKGIISGNFSEVEGGKRAIVRGTVKIVPGNIQQKKELEKKLENRTRAIGIGLAAVTGGLGFHALLMKSNTFGYREGVGANINNSVRLGMSRVLDATPIIGAKRARVRAQVQSGIEAQLKRQANPVESVLKSQLARTKPAQADTDARSKLVAALQAVNDSHRGAKSSFDAWNKEHQKAFYTTTKRESGVGLGPREEGNVFARPATDEFLTRQFNLQGDDTLTSKSIKDAVQRQLTDYKSSLLDLAQQQGFSVISTRNGRVIAEKDQRGFIQGIVKSTLPKGQGSPTVRSALTKHLEETLTLSPKGRTDALYRDTYKGFDEFYKSQGSVITNATKSTRMTKALRATGAEETMLNGTMARSQFLLGLTRPGQRVQGPAHAELVLRDYHAAVTGTGPRRMYTVTDRLALAAASELEGRTVNKGEAFQILEREGYTRAVPKRTAATPRTRPMTEGEAVYALMRENPGMTLQAARREVKRRRGDEDDSSPELVRTATYLAARADFKESKRLGKPCGASHITKAYECRKGQGASKPPGGRGKAAAKVALATGVVLGAATIATNPKLRQRARVEARLILKGSDNAVREALKLGGRGAVAGLSAKQVKEGLSKLPEPLQGPARKLVGAAKQGAASMALKAEGYSIQDIDVVNNFSTWKNKKGTLISIGSYGDSLVTYASDNSHSWNGKRVYKIGFNVDQSFDATRTIPTEQARTITSAVRKMTDNHLNKINDGVLATFPWDGDDYGAKRRAIYARAGFNNIVGEESQWAIVQKGRIKKMTPAESFIFLAESGERDAPIYKPAKPDRKDALLKPDGRR